MANKTISMSKVRNIIKLYSQGIGKKNIAERLSLSKNTVKTYVKKFLKLGRSINELLDMSDQDLNNLFNPPTQPNKPMRLEKLQEFFPLMEKKLRRRGTTVGMLYREFKQNNPDTIIMDCGGRRSVRVCTSNTRLETKCMLIMQERNCHTWMKTQEK